MANGLLLKRPPLRSHKDSAACLAVCAKCPEYNKPVHFHCECWTGNVKRHAIISTERCPRGKWNDALRKDGKPKAPAAKPFAPTLSKPPDKAIMMLSTGFRRECADAIVAACAVHKVDVIPRFGMNRFVEHIDKYQNIITWGLRNYSNKWYQDRGKNILFLENGLFWQGDGYFIDSDGYFSGSTISTNREYDLEANDEEMARIKRLTKQHFGWELLSYAYDPEGPILYCIQLDRDWPCKHQFPAKIPGMDNIASGLRLLAEFCPDREVIIRPHPKHASRDEDRKEWEAKVDGYKSLFRDNWRLEPGGSVYDVIKGCSAVVTINSTVATEALSLGIPVATLGEGAYSGSGVTLECAKAPDLLERLLSWGKCEGCEKAAKNRRVLNYLGAVMRHQLPKTPDLATVLKSEPFVKWIARNTQAASPTSYWFPSGDGLYSGTIPKILHFIWIGSSLPEFAEFNIAKWHEMNPDYAVMVHGKEILHIEHEYMYHLLNRNDHWADVLKWSALRTYGGWTIDVDTVPLRPMSTFTDTLNENTDFVAVKVPPRDEHRGMTRCDMGFLGAKTDARLWASVQWFLNGKSGDEPRKGRALGGIRCMDYVLRTVPHLINKQDSTLYCPYSRKDTDWIKKGQAFFKALRAGQDVSKFIAEYDAAFGNPLAWHLWRTAV